MRLLLISLLAFGYVTASGISAMPWKWPAKALAVLAVLLVSLKYVLYRAIGGSFFAPSLPRVVQLGMESLYGALLVLVVLLLCKDLLKVVCWLARQCGLPWRLPFSPAARNLGLMALSVCLGVWGTWQAVRVPDVRTVELVVPRLPALLDGTTLVQLTDLHLGPLQQQSWLRGVVDKVNALRPDFIVLTGDLVDIPPERAGDVAPLGGLQARHGVFGVLGNHEYYAGAQGWKNAFTRLGICILRNEHQVVELDGGQIVMAGLTDYAESRFGGQMPDFLQALAGSPADAVRILLVHQPRGARSHHLVDIQLSGHTHGGQMFFLHPLIACFNDGFVRGVYRMGTMQLYVSPGTGLWGGFACRIGVPSEITRIVLRAPFATEGGGVLGKTMRSTRED